MMLTMQRKEGPPPPPPLVIIVVVVVEVVVVVVVVVEARIAWADDNIVTAILSILLLSFTCGPEKE